MTPLLSIITVTFNAQDTVGHTVKSIVEQTGGNWELLIIDGASTDNTLEIVRSIAGDKAIILSEKDKGIYDAMNKGLALARGRYVLFLNAGDSFHDVDVLKRFEEAASLNPDAGVIYGQTVLVDNDRKVVGQRHLNAPEVLEVDSFANGMVVCHQAFFARRDLTEPYDLRYTLSADYLWCLKVLQRSTLNVYLGHQPIIDFLVGGATAKNHFRSLRQRFRIMCRHYGSLPTVARHIKFLFRAIKRKFA